MYLMIGWSILILLSYSNLIPAVAGLPLDHIGSFINVLIIAYTISRFRLLDIRFVVRRGLAFALALIPIAAIYVSGLWITFKFYLGLPFYTLLLLSVTLAILLAL